jgi:YVTN family beta-propeller protein
MMSNGFRNFMQWVSLSAVLVLAAGTAGAATLAYVTNQDSNDVSVIDTASNTVIATIPVGHRPQGLAGTPDGKFVYVANSDGITGAVSVIDTATNAVVATVADIPAATEVAITPNGAFAYVIKNCDVCTSGGVVVIDTASNSVVATIPLTGIPVRPRDIAITPNGAFAYVTSASLGVIVIDTATNTVTNTIPAFAKGIAITPNGAFAYMATAFPDKVSVLDTSTNTFTTTIPLTRPNRVAISPDGAFAYVTQTAPASSVTLIETATNFTSSVATGDAFGVAVTPDSQFAYVALGTANAVSAVTLGFAGPEVVATIPVGLNAYDVAIVTPPAPSGPTSADQCKKGGWMTFTNPKFKNQGDCVSYVNHL